MVESIQSYALVGATVIDGHGGNPLNDAVVFIDNGAIKEVGSLESITLGDEITKIDVKGHYILPGLIDAHVHMVGVGSPKLLDNIVESNYLQAVVRVKKNGQQICTLPGMSWKSLWKKLGWLVYR